MRQAIEGQIGMLTCQLIEANIQLRMARLEIDRLNELVEYQKTEAFEKAMAEQVARDEVKFELEA